MASFYGTLHVVKTRKMFSNKDQGQVEHVIVLTRQHVLDSAANHNLNQLTSIVTLTLT